MEYEVNKIDNWEDFQILTTLEAKQHRLNERSYKRIDRSYKVDSLYLPTISQDRKRFLYEEYELKRRTNLKVNRARYFVEYIEEDSILVDKTFSMPDTISTECVCELKNDTIQIEMGVWVFGGYFYNISIENKNYKLVYTEDAHETKPFKYKTTDSTFVEDLELKVKKSSLTFMEEIRMEIDEQINGYLKFESPQYYVKSSFRGSPRINKLKTGVTKGEIYFTCKLREPFEPQRE